VIDPEPPPPTEAPPATGETARALTPAPAPPLEPPRAGELSPGWRIVTAVTWIGVVVALAAVWNASVQLGLSTWWLGPRAQPRPRVVQLSPFVPAVLMLLGTINHVRWLGWFGLAASGVVAACGVADLDRFDSLAVLQVLIGAAAAVVSVASLSGTYRRAATAGDDAGDDATDDGAVAPPPPR
jgi:hypothetical protein